MSDDTTQNDKTVQEDGSIPVWVQSELNAYMLQTMRSFMDVYQKAYDEAVEEAETFEGEDKNKKLKLAAQYTGLIYAASKAERGLQLGQSFTQAMWGLQTDAPLTNSWVIVRQVDYSPMIQGVGVVLGKDEIEFLFKPDGSFQGFATYPIHEARRLCSMLINGTPDEQNHWFYIYNLITGTEERIIYGESLFDFN